MIKSIADFLEAFKEKSLQVIIEKEGHIRHNPTIGNIYEGLTSEILKRAIFKDLNLNIVQNSFVYNDSGMISSEMDCMIVIGNGTRISFTNQYKYHIKDVIAVIQVKKGLYSQEMEDAYLNLKNIVAIAEPRNGEIFMRQLQRDAYKLLMSAELPKTDEIYNLSEREQIIYHLLLMQAFWPSRIVMGYYGYKSEYSLREGFVKNLEEKIANNQGKLTPGYSPVSFPDIIISGNNTIVKNIGMPFGAPFSKGREFYWPIFSSYNKKPSYYLLEIIWTRLSYIFNISSDVFGDDYQSDSSHPLLWAKETKITDDKWGWEYYYNQLTRNQLKIELKAEAWAPTKITQAEQTLILLIMSKGSINIDDKLENFLILYDQAINDIVDYLSNEQIIYIEKNSIKLLLDDPMIVSNQEGIFIGENSSGQFTSWLNEK